MYCTQSVLVLNHLTSNRIIIALNDNSYAYNHTKVTLETEIAENLLLQQNVISHPVIYLTIETVTTASIEDKETPRGVINESTSYGQMFAIVNGIVQYTTDDDVYPL